MVDRFAHWADEVGALARLGRHYAENAFDRDRYERLARIAAEMTSAATGLAPEDVLARWERDVGYVTPKVGVAAAVFDESGALLLIRRPDTGRWAMPGGWADVGDTPAEMAVRETQEETGLDVRVERLVGVYDNRRHHSRNPHHFYRLVFICRCVGGKSGPTSEALEVGYFREDALPPDLELTHRQGVADAFALRRDPNRAPFFDP